MGTQYHLRTQVGKYFISANGMTYIIMYGALNVIGEGTVMNASPRGKINCIWERSLLKAIISQLFPLLQLS